MTRKKVPRSEPKRKPATKPKPTRRRGGSSVAISETYMRQRAGLTELVSGDVRKNLPRLTKSFATIAPTTDDLKDFFSARLLTRFAQSLDIPTWNAVFDILACSESLQEDFQNEILKAVNGITTGPRLCAFLDHMLSSSPGARLFPVLKKAITSKDRWHHQYLDRIDIGANGHASAPPLTVDGARLVAAFNPETLLCRDRTVTLTDEIVSALSQNDRAEHCEFDAADLSRMSPNSFAMLPGVHLAITIPTMSPATANALAGRKGGLTIRGLEDLTAEAAAALKCFRGELDIPDLGKVAPAVAAEFAGFQGEMLRLNGVTRLSSEAASHLSRCRKLELLGLETIDHGDGEAALLERLVSSESTVVYLRLKEISAEGAAAVASHAGKLDVRLEQLTSLTPEAAAHLARCRGNVSIGCERMTAHTAGAFAMHGGTLTLGLKSLTPEIARALARHKGPLRFDSIETLSGSCCLPFREHSSGLSLHNNQGETTMDKDAVDALATYRGALEASPRILSRIDAARRKNRRG